MDTEERNEKWIKIVITSGPVFEGDQCKWRWQKYVDDVLVLEHTHDDQDSMRNDMMDDLVQDNRKES